MDGRALRRYFPLFREAIPGGRSRRFVFDLGTRETVPRASLADAAATAGEWNDREVHRGAR